MPLIKAHHAPSLTPFSMADIEAAARRILLRARAQAEQLLAEAQEQAENLRTAAAAEGLAAGRQEGLRQGREEGCRAGHDEALAAAQAQLTQLIQTLSSTAAQLDASRRELQASAVAEVVDLAIALARRVIKRQAAADPQVLTANLAQVMPLVIHAADVRIVLHPSQTQLLEKELPNLQLQWPNLKHVEIIGDESVAPGGCRLKTLQGDVDADLCAQLDRIVEEMTGRPAPSA